jgi:hypothetical protein
MSGGSIATVAAPCFLLSGRSTVFNAADLAISA